MYDYIQGEVTELTPAYAVVEAGGVGYYLVISLQTYAELNISPQPAYIPISRYAKTHRRCTASPHARNARFSGCWSASRVSGETQLA